MSNIKFLCGVFIILLFSVSCKEVLETTPKNALTDLNYWQNTDELKLYCNNFYTILSTPGTGSDNQSDNIVTKAPNSWLFNQSPVPSSGGGWSNGDWAVIRNANYFLTHYQSATGTPSEISHYVGEIKFFRAYDYFNKVKNFGDVPWINKDLNTNDTVFLYKARDPRKVVVDSIIADLNFAATNMWAPAQLEKGRLHKYAALQLLARVGLYEGTYMKYRGISGWEDYLNIAATAAKTIIDQGGYDIVKPNALYFYKTGDLINAQTNTYATEDYPLYYKEQFIQEDLTTNKECVLPKIFVKDILAHGLSRSVNEANVGVSKDFIEDFLCTDGLPIRLSSLYKGDDSVMAEISNRDPRLRNMIDNRFLPFYLNSANQPVSNYLTQPGGSATPTGYLAFKFRNPVPAQNEANAATFDMYIFRYAEVLLIYAEAKAELGTITENDLEITINKLRARLDEPSLPDGKMARLTLTPPADPAATTITGQPRYGYAVSPLIYEIRRERRIELAFEGFRWDDIVRWKAGKLIENPKTEYGIVVNTDVKNQYNAYFGSDLFGSAILATITDWDKTKQLLSPYSDPSRTWDDKLYLHPIPTDQIILSNGALVQTQGW